MRNRSIINKRELLMGAGALSVLAVSSVSNAESSKKSQLEQVEAQLEAGKGFIRDFESGKNFTLSSISKGLTLTADAAFLYASLYSQLEDKKDRAKLRGAITIAHGVLAAIGTIAPKVLEENMPNAQKTITMLASTIAIGYVLFELGGDEDEKEEDHTDLIDRIKGKEGVLSLAFSGPVLLVSYDALFSSLGKYGAMDARGLNTTEIAISTALMTAAIWILLEVLEYGITEMTPGAVKALSKEGLLKGRGMMKAVFGLESEGDELTEEAVMKLVFILIGSFGIRGAMQEGLGYSGRDVGPFGTTYEALALSLAGTLLVDRTEVGQEIADIFRKRVKQLVATAKG